MPTKAYVQKPEKRAVLSERDAATLDRNGWVVTNDTQVRGEVITVYEIDEDTLKSRPVGYAIDDKKVSHVLNNVKKGRVKNRAIRPADLVDLGEICRRTGRKKGNVVGKWKKDPTWPEPVTQLGRSEGYYWPDIKEFLQKKGLPLRKGTWWTDNSEQ